MKKYYDNLAVLLGEQCNMQCAHCMRGEPTNNRISHEVIDSLLDDCSGIGSLTFTGGEVSLYTDEMRYFLEKCEENDVSVLNVYIVTNAKVVTNDFLLTVIDWLSYVDDSDNISAITISMDQFHEKVSEDNVRKIKTLAAYREDKVVDFEKSALLNLGRARNLTGFKKRESSHILPDDFPQYIKKYAEDEDYFFEELVTILTNGDVITDCDFEFGNTDHLKIGNIFDPFWVEKLLGIFGEPKYSDVKESFDLNVSNEEWCKPKIDNIIRTKDDTKVEIGVYREADGTYSLQIFANDDVILCKTL